MSDDKKKEQFMLQRDRKESQRRENYRRAEAFLYWKVGEHIHELNREFRGAPFGDFASLLVEFAEKVEEDLLERMRYIEELYFKDIQLKAMIGPMQLKPEDFFIGKSYPPQEEEKPNGK
jgi:hypothetical protein